MPCRPSEAAVVLRSRGGDGISPTFATYISLVPGRLRAAGQGLPALLHLSWRAASTQNPEPTLEVLTHQVWVGPRNLHSSQCPPPPVLLLA